MLTYNLGPLPLSLAHQDGSLNKTTNSTLLHSIESQVEPNYVTPGSTWIVDSMAMLQEFASIFIFIERNIPPTFGLLADYLLKQLIELAQSFMNDVPQQ